MVGMIDTHSHLLPAVDDGSRSIDESMELLRLCVDDGVDTQVLTPHFPDNIYGNSVEMLTIVFDNFKLAAKREGIDIQLELAGEVKVTQEIIPLIQSESFPWLGMWEGRKVFLMEFPFQRISSGLINLVDWLSKKGIMPLIAHPERCAEIQNNINKIKPFLDAGCLLQITAGSLNGAFGKAVFSAGCELLKMCETPVIASDCHRLDSRPPGGLGAAARVAADVIGSEAAQAAVDEIPRKMVEGLKAVH